MKRKIVLALVCCMVMSLAGCGAQSGAESGAEGGLQIESIPASEASVESNVPKAPEATEADNTAQEQVSEETSDLITEDQAREAVKKYCIEDFPDLADMVDSDEYTIYWEAATIETGEICVLYRAYTGALIRYYVNPETGDARVTEQVPGIIDEEQSTGETVNIRKYID